MRYLLSAAIVLAGVSGAFAADVPPPVYKAPPAVVAAAPWSGLYFGAIVSGAKTKGEFDFVTIPGTGNLHPTGIMPGAVVGAGFWSGAMWLGVEADAGYDFAKTDNACVVVLDCKIKSSVFLTQRGIIGMPLAAITGAAQNKANSAGWPTPLAVPANLSAAALMPYLTAGVAERRIEACISGVLMALGQTCGREWLVGWTAGGGLRIPVSMNFSLDVSYLYVGYNKNFVTAPGVAIFPGTFDAKSEQVGRLSLIGHF